ncbi:hypothetical protein [Derxia gummosa]|uniref:Uncharacterized protein n=1 Tax=Derxia gummosa DSM 723 TaxID=1121388 RepID=A0A8B6X214_9BURK|nr:hypothetical protein [Derxia gummosa]
MSAKHVLRWVGAEAFVAQPVRPSPSLLRFDGDDFMDRLLALLAQAPQTLPQLVAKPESWSAVAAPTPEPLPAGVALNSSRPARLLKRSTALLGFRRDAQAAQSPAMAGEVATLPAAGVTAAGAAASAGVVPSAGAGNAAAGAALLPGTLGTTSSVLKLFQPVHQRYYLAAAHLVCELPGLPPRVTSGGDKSGVVLRRLFSVKGADGATRVVEHAWVKPPSGPGYWAPLARPAAACADGEEWLPTFPLGYQPPAGPRRTLLGALVPVARHDEYRFARRATEWAGTDGAGGLAPAAGLGAGGAGSAAGAASGASAATTTAALDARAADLRALARMKVIAPWQGLVERAVQSLQSARISFNDDQEEVTASAAQLQSACVTLNDQLCEASWRLMQDCREFLDAYLPRIAARLGQTAPANPPASDTAGRLLRALEDVTWPASWRTTLPDSITRSLSTAVVKPARPLAVSLRAALDAIPAASAGLDAADQTFSSATDGAPLQWPAFALPLVLGDVGGTAASADPRLRLPFDGGNASFVLDDAAQDNAIAFIDAFAATLEDAIDAAVKAGESGAATPQAAAAARLADDLKAALADDAGPPRFVLRFVHRRCDCGPLHPLVISAPSEVFELAGFFDSDAPLRPIRIALPFDTSPGGLRKFGRNSAFIMSDLLCGQMKRVRRLGFGDMVRSVLPWPFHKDLKVTDMQPCGGPAASFGTICSLSIPIITLVAFILLIVIATLLDLIFRWLPFLIACFPVPGLKGKR